MSDKWKKDYSLVCDDGYYLIIITYDPERDIWIVDEDSRHILEKCAGGYTVQEIEGQIIRPLTDTVMSPTGGKVMSDQLSIEEINTRLQEAANKDMKDQGPYEFTIGVEEDDDEWDEFIECVVASDPPVDSEEEV